MWRAYYTRSCSHSPPLWFWDRLSRWHYRYHVIITTSGTALKTNLYFSKSRCGWKLSNRHENLKKKKRYICTVEHEDDESEKLLGRIHKKTCQTAIMDYIFSQIIIWSIKCQNMERITNLNLTQLRGTHSNVLFNMTNSTKPKVHHNTWWKASYYILNAKTSEWLAFLLDKWLKWLIRYQNSLIFWCYTNQLID